MKYYAVYDLNDNYVTMFWNYKELSKWFKKSIESMHSSVTRFKKGEIDSIRSNDDNCNYKIYQYQEDDPND